MLHPNQFHVNEAWIAFKLNDAPILTEAEGEFDLIALMDAASCFMLSSTLVSKSAAEPTKLEARRLLKQAHAHKKEFPKTLFIQGEQPAQFLTVEAERQGITVVRVPEDQLLLIVGESREAFKERFGAGSGEGEA